jgi:exodeoxyribonuclease VII small subunit
LKTSKPVEPWQRHGEAPGDHLSFEYVVVLNTSFSFRPKTGTPWHGQAQRSGQILFRSTPENLFNSGEQLTILELPTGLTGYRWGRTTVESWQELSLPKFEDCLQRLEKIVQELEKGEVPLEKSLTLFEEGMQLSNACRKELEEAEGKVEILLKQNGKLQPEPFEALGERAVSRK